MYWDRSLPGFGVRVSGSKSDIGYIVQRDLPPNGKTRRVTIGTVGEITFDKAREEAKDIIHGMRRGIDPKAARLGRGAETLEANLALYIDRHPLSEKSKRDYASMVRRHLDDWLKLSIGTISGEMVEDRYHSLVEKKGIANANLCMRIFRTVYNYAKERDRSLPPNPTGLLKRQWKKLPRKRTLVGAGRLSKFYAAVTQLPNRIQRDYLLFVLFTGLRRTAAASLKWDQVDFTEKVIRIPAERTKHKRDEFKLPMTDFVRDLLLAIGTYSEGGFVFPANSASGHVSEPKYPLGLIAEATGISISIHDLRRDFVTAAQNALVSPFALKALVDHILPVDSGDVSGGYMDMPVSSLREPAQRVCDQLKAWCGIADRQKP
jgi:integrase